MPPKDIETRRAYHRARYAANREIMQAYYRQYNQLNSDKRALQRKARYDPVKARQYKQEWYTKNPEKLRQYHYMKRYGMTIEETQNLLQLQGSRCQICKKKISLERTAKRDVTASVDHCHVTGRVRGLLCDGCNGGLGKLGDDESGLMNAIYYLRGPEGTAGISEGFLF